MLIRRTSSKRAVIKDEGTVARNKLWVVCQKFFQNQHLQDLPDESQISKVSQFISLRKLFKVAGNQFSSSLGRA